MAVDWTESLLRNRPHQVLKAEQVLRWRTRRLLALLPQRVPPAGGSRSAAGRIVYFFAGTYGDFVMIIPVLRRLAATYPKAELVLAGDVDYAREFRSEIPRSFRIAASLEPWMWIFRPMDMLFTNAVGVYRVRFDLAARFCARRAFGFRHSNESRRGGYARTIRLDGKVRSFAEENLKLLDLAEVPPMRSSLSGALLGGVPDVAPAWGKGRILFHIGSTGLKRDFGLPAYSRMVLNILSKLDERPVEVVMGPHDHDIAMEVTGGSQFVPHMYPVTRLVRMLRSFEGTILCFNSFLAHLCRYLGRPAIVIHRQAVPYGYDCSPLHKQIILRKESDWDLGGVWEALGLEADE